MYGTYAGSTCGDGEQEWEAFSACLLRWAADPDLLMAQGVRVGGLASLTTTRDTDAGAHSAQRLCCHFRFRFACHSSSAHFMAFYKRCTVRAQVCGKRTRGREGAVQVSALTAAQTIDRLFSAKGCRQNLGACMQGPR